MAHNVFFSWQSDIRGRAGRGLVEASLKAAIKALKSDSELEPAHRNLAIDRDVLKTPGQPPLMEVIFDKIARAAVFVGDMTFVGERTNKERTPNPNVLIEYGWALKALSWRRIILVMNTSFGDPKEHELPFDLKHMLHPITFECAEDADDATRTAARDSLTKDLTRALKLIFEDPVALAQMKPAPPAEPHPHDVKLLQDVHALLTTDTRTFLHEHNFGNPFQRAKLDAVHRIAGWVSAAYEFHDPELQTGFVKLRGAITAFAEIALERLYALDNQPHMASALTDMDRAHEVRPQTLKVIKTLNDRASALSTEIDAFDRLARDRIRIAIGSEQAHVEEVDPREARAGEALAELAMDVHRGQFPVIVTRPRVLLKLAPFAATEGRRLNPADAMQIRNQFPFIEGESVVKDADAHQWWACAQLKHRNGLPNPESAWCMRIVRPGNFEFQGTIGRRVDDDEDILVDGRKLEGLIVEQSERMAMFARVLGFEGRALISVHFDGTEDVRLMRPGPGGRRIRQHQIGLPQVAIQDLREPIAPALHEVFDIMWQSGGWGDGSNSYQNGKWLGYENAETYNWAS